MELPLLFSAHPLMILFIYTQFHENTFIGFTIKKWTWFLKGELFHQNYRSRWSYGSCSLNIICWCLILAQDCQTCRWSLKDILWWCYIAVPSFVNKHKCTFNLSSVMKRTLFVMDKQTDRQTILKKQNVSPPSPTSLSGRGRQNKWFTLCYACFECSCFFFLRFCFCFHLKFLKI